MHSFNSHAVINYYHNKRQLAVSLDIYLPLCLVLQNQTTLSVGFFVCFGYVCVRDRGRIRACVHSKGGEGQKKAAKMFLAFEGCRAYLTGAMICTLVLRTVYQWLNH